MVTEEEDDQDNSRPPTHPAGEDVPEPSSFSPSSSTPLVEVDIVRTLDIADSDPNSSSLSPVWLLIVLCIINLLNYVDRGAIASNGVNGSIRTCNDKGKCTAGSGIQGHFDLNNFQDGILSSAFMVGLLVASPIFASLANSFNPFRLIGVGLTVWTVAVLGCGSSFAFWFIVVCRMFVGVGEASFISLAAPFIDDNAPRKQRTAWLAMFYMCIPTGVALGYVYGGFVGRHLNWRYSFWGEAILMAPFALFGFWMKPLQLKGFTPNSKKALISVQTTAACVDSETSKTTDHLPDANEIVRNQASNEACKPTYASAIWKSVTRFAKDMKVLLKDKVFVVNVLGFVSYNFVIGAYSYWGPKAGYNIYKMKNADMTFGGITIICGIVGTLSGGFALDRVTATISNAFKLLSVATFLGAIFCFTAFTLKSLYGFIALFSLGELLVFATQAPVNYVCLHCVKPSLRPLSMAISTVAIHIFGDVPSSPLVGVVQDHLNNWRKTALILTSILFLAAATWFIGIFLNSVDRFEGEETRIEILRTNNANSTTV